MLSSIQNLREVVESAKHVMTRERLNNWLAGQRLTLYMSLSTHPSAKNNTAKFDEYNLMNNQIDRLAKVMDSVILLASNVIVLM